MTSSKYPQLNDRAWLSHQYTTRKRTVLEISREIGCSKGATRYSLKKHGIPIQDWNGARGRIRPRAIINDPDLAIRLGLNHGEVIGA